MTTRHHSLLALLCLWVAAAVTAQPLAYIAVGEPINALRVIDTQTRLDARAPIGLPYAPEGAVAVSPNGRRVYIAAVASFPTMVVDTATGQVTLDPSLPTVGTLSGDGRRMYFALGTVDLTTGQRWPAGSTLGGPAYAAGPEGVVYAAWCSQDTPPACEIRARAALSGDVLWSVPAANHVGAVAVSADGKFVNTRTTSYRFLNPPAIGAISTESHGYAWAGSLGAEGFCPGRMAASPDGQRLYALNGKAPQVDVFDQGTGSFLKHIPLGLGELHPECSQWSTYGGIAVSPDNRSLWVTNGTHGSVSVIDTTTLEVVATLGGFGNAVSYANFIGPLAKDAAIEYYNANLDHYFLTAHPAEIHAIDAGVVAGWKRTGQQFTAHPPRSAGAKPVCRIYIPPALGDSHFYSASATECDEVVTKFPALILESRDLFYVDLPDPVTGSCPPGGTPVYRLWNKRADSNHRYTTSGAVRDAMVAKGYQPEGYGPGAIAMCAP